MTDYYVIGLAFGLSAGVAAATLWLCHYLLSRPSWRDHHELKEIVQRNEVRIDDLYEWIADIDVGLQHEKEERP